MFRIKFNWVIGFLIIIIGIVLLTNNLGYSEINIGYYIATLWPVFIVIAGINFLLNKGSRGEVITGVAFILFGCILIGNNLNIIDIDLSMLWRLFWPLILILVGINIIFSRKSNGKSNLAFMGAVEKNTEPWNLQEGSYAAVMGGIELDLTLAEIPQGETTIDLTAVMGGIDVFIPDDLDVKCSGSTILGGIELLDKSTGGIIASASNAQSGTSGKTVVFKCTAIMGGIEIKRKRDKK